MLPRNTFSGRTLRLAATVALALALAAPVSHAAKKDPLLSAMTKELKRSFKKLKHAEKVPLYFLHYSVSDETTVSLGALLGAIHYDYSDHVRKFDVDVRVGNRRFDNTHQIKGREGWYDSSSKRSSRLPVEDDEAAMRVVMWLSTDKTYKAALKRYAKAKTNKAVTAKEDDQSDDFSKEKPSRSYRPVAPPAVDVEAWKKRLKGLSLAFKPYDHILNSNVALSVKTANRYMVNSEGSRVVTGNVYIRLSFSLGTQAEDGMPLHRFKSYNADTIEDLPSDEEVLRDILTAVRELKALMDGPLVEPYTGPAIFRNKATGVYFHEIMGHRLEGHRQKLEDEGQTFKKQLGKPVVASFISVYDDPTVDRFDGEALRGFYHFDDEAVPSQRVTLIKDGILKNFLLSRMPIDRFPNSNGHGRRSPGRDVVARMGNIIVKAARTVPYKKLREMLIDEIKRQGKPYGLIFDDISGGFTGTSRSGPQSFKVTPVLVWQVFPDGRPDRAVRGVDIVGTPLTSFGKIIAAADDYGIFNGTCGAESGWVPVSAVAPSILLSELEVEKKAKFSEKPPVLPAPFHDPLAPEKKR